MISLETRASLVTERANVVFPVSLIHERAGRFVNWEGRHRAFDVVISQPNGMSDLRVLAALADGLGADLGFRTAAQARAELVELGAWDGDARAPDYPARLASRGEPAGDGAVEVVLATWRMALDRQPGDGRRAQPAGDRTGAGRRVSPATAAEAGLATGRDDRQRPGLAAAAGVSTRRWWTAWSGCRAGPAGSSCRALGGRAAGDLVTARRRRSQLGGDRDEPARSRVFFNDPWWVVVLKALFALVVLLVLTLFTIWFERRVVAFMQHRKGPKMNGPFGLCSLWPTA